MSSRELAAIVDSLTSEQQAAVREFIEFLKSKSTQPDSRFRAAIDEFMDQHPELLHRLAQ